MLLVARGELQREELGKAIEEFDRLVDAMLAKAPPAEERLVDVSTEVDEVWNTVLAAQRGDIRRLTSRRCSCAPLATTTNCIRAVRSPE